MFVVLTDFRDLRDGGYQYKKGDTYPRKGVALNSDRAKHLMTPTTMRGALIEEKKEEVAKPTKKKAEKAE